MAEAAGLGCNDLAQRVYAAMEGELSPVADIEPWRARPAFRVFTDTREG